MYLLRNRFLLHYTRGWPVHLPGGGGRPSLAAPYGPRLGSTYSPGTEVPRVSLKQLVQRAISAWEREDYEEALATFREVLEGNPHFADIQHKAGLCMAMLGDPKGALGALMRLSP